LPLDSGPKISSTRPRARLAAQRDVEAQAAGGDALHRRDVVVVELHHRALAELLFDLLDGAGERRIAGGVARRRRGAATAGA